MNRISDEQQRRNQLARSCWQLFASHRHRVTELLTEPAPAAEATLYVLGAGNSNDLDLVRLAQAFREIHLVDLDSQALAQGVAAQFPAGQPRVLQHGGVDVTGMADLLSRWIDCPPTEVDVNQALASVPDRVVLPPNGRSHVVASVCLLSQLFDAVKQSLGDQHPQYLHLVQALRQQHLRQLVRLCQPGGRLLLVTDFVSSDTCPDLTAVAEGELPGFASRQIAASNFFTGLNPFVLRSLLDSDAWLASRLTAPRLTSPWLWQHPARTYAVCALQAVKSAIEEELA